MKQTAFVFVYLPDDIHPVVAGRFDLQTDVLPNVGTFVYAASYLENPRAVPLDPVALVHSSDKFALASPPSLDPHVA